MKEKLEKAKEKVENVKGNALMFVDQHAYEISAILCAVSGAFIGAAFGFCKGANWNFKTIRDLGCLDMNKYMALLEEDLTNL